MQAKGSSVHLQLKVSQLACGSQTESCRRNDMLIFDTELAIAGKDDSAARASWCGKDNPPESIGGEAAALT